MRSHTAVRTAADRAGELAHLTAASLAAIVLAAAIATTPLLAQTQGQCTIKDSPCYPWRIEVGESETTLLEVIPNNAITSTTYRVCLCQPTKSVSIMFDFNERKVSLGAVPSASNGPVCRDFKIQTARSSRLLLRRPDGSTEAVEGCYATF